MQNDTAKVRCKTPVHGNRRSVRKSNSGVEKYKKRIAEGLTPVERDYLATIKDAQKKLKKS